MWQLPTAWLWPNLRSENVLKHWLPSYWRSSLQHNSPASLVHSCPQAKGRYLVNAHSGYQFLLASKVLAPCADEGSIQL
jgi:hypothetical protein